MNRIRREGDVIILRVGGPDEWAASNAIVAEARARWEAETAAKNGETSEVQLDGAQDQTVAVKVGGRDENKTFDAITAHYKELAEAATSETASVLPSKLHDQTGR